MVLFKEIYFVIFLIKSAFTFQWPELCLELKISNPIIIINKSLPQNVFPMFKSLSKAYQMSAFVYSDEITLLNISDISFISFVNGTISKSLKSIEKPSLLFQEDETKFTRIDQQIYFIDNKTLTERYKIKDLQISAKLGSFDDGGFLKWKSNTERNFLERRANFHNITLISMADSDGLKLRYPKNIRSLRNLSTIVPETYDVTYQLTTHKPFRKRYIFSFSDHWLNLGQLQRIPGYHIKNFECYCAPI